VWPLLRSLLFRLDPERAHYLAMAALAALCRIPGARRLLAAVCTADDPALAVEVFGLRFAGPVGLAAGFDKDARWHRDLAALGFSHVEVGTLTARPQPGNPQPRLFRLAADRALINRFGFNNGGAADAAGRLVERAPGTVLGVNIGRNKDVANDDAVANYLEAFDAIAGRADYIVVNVSSPNTPGLRGLQDRPALEALLAALQRQNERLAEQAGGQPRPLLVKIAPDLSDAQLDEIADLALSLGLSGIIATNTTLSRAGLATPAAEIEQIGAGGLSGAPLTERSRAVVAHLYRRLGRRIPIIGVGGVASGEDAWAMIRAGATLVQLYTGFVYGGPWSVARIHRELRCRLGDQPLNDVVGLDAERYAAPTQASRTP
jgi:dihydroorotate dehydrogenase